MGYKSKTQEKNVAWYLPRPKPDKYKGGMPLHCEKWLLELATDLHDKDDPSIMNIFCGMNTEGFRVDIKPEVKPDIVCDVHELTKHVTQTFDIILADPPYSNEESKDLYNTPKLNYKQWTSEANNLLNDQGLLIIYHKYVMPNPNPKMYKVVKRAFVGNRIYHVPRVAIYFKKDMKGMRE